MNEYNSKSNLRKSRLAYKWFANELKMMQTICLNLNTKTKEINVNHRLTDCNLRYEKKLDSSETTYELGAIQIIRDTFPTPLTLYLF